MNIGKLIQSVKMAVKSIMGNKGRSALTMLGVIIGVASVILLTGIGGFGRYRRVSFKSRNKAYNGKLFERIYVTLGEN